MKKSYIARIFMVLTSLAVLIAMSGCAGGNASNELTDEQLLEMVEARGLEAGTAEETDDDEIEIAVGWTIGLGNVALNIPSTAWAYAYNNESLEIWGTVDEETQANMNLFHVYLLEREFDEWLDSSTSWEYFMFDDGHLGYKVTFNNRTVWVHNLDSLRAHAHAQLWLDHDGDTTILLDNQELIMAIARSMTVTGATQETADQWNDSAQEVVSDTQDQGLEQIASELVGLWTVTNPFGTWHEQIQEGNMIFFDANGTGWQDDFGFGINLGEFIWHIEIAEGWDGPTVFLAPTLFMNFPNQTISFTLNGGDTIFEDPFGDGNWAIPLHQGAGSPFYLVPFMP